MNELITAKIGKDDILLLKKNYKRSGNIRPCVHCAMNGLIKKSDPIQCSKYVPDCRAHMGNDGVVKIYKLYKGK